MLLRALVGEDNPPVISTNKGKEQLRSTKEKVGSKVSCNSCLLQWLIEKDKRE